MTAELEQFLRRPRCRHRWIRREEGQGRPLGWYCVECSGLVAPVMVDRIVSLGRIQSL